MSVLPPHLVADVGRLAALVAWRVTQGIYRFDPELLQAVITTDLDGDLPHDVLFRLPEWCVYIETPGLLGLEGAPLHGFFAHLEHDTNTSRPELRLLLDSAASLRPLPLHLGPWSLRESLERMGKESQEQARRTLAVEIDLEATAPAGAMVPLLAPLVSLVLYLCATNAEIGDGKLQPSKPQPKRVAGKPRLFPADGPKVWDVGVRMGSALRRAYQARESSEAGGAHAGPVPHIRRAHYHGYWLGPRDEAERRRLDVRWMPPIPVNVDDLDAMPATVRSVTP